MPSGPSKSPGPGAPGTIAELEAALAQAWDPTHLSVLADALQAAGDPRGELIALDLHADAHGVSAEHQARKQELALAWLGPLGGYHAVGVDHGFMTLDFTADESEVALRQILEHPQARTLRKLSLGGEARVLARYLDLLTGTREVFPWLRALELRRFDMAWQPAIDGTTAKRLIAMTPALEDLSLRGHYVLGTFSHPNLRRLALDNYFAGRHMRDADHVLPALTEARLGLGPGPWSENELFLLFSAKRTPALRHLDISAPPRHSLMALLAGLGQMSARRQLTHLYLPAFVTVYEVARLDVTIRSMEDLIEIHVPAELPAPIGHPAQVIVGAGRAGP